LIGKIFGAELVFVLVGAMLGGFSALVGETEPSSGTSYVPDGYARIQAAVDAAK
jgi:hypothetical protein